ncbi:predicted protein [Histoplasma capsulatum G186AR]|uniref:Uncharacterized protein n=1 Tax=Ajellomyces capsulatus (strain G186AR / H82 / ATCC MYA-2454 / RMSCC 2432) TaxID=447093 RepID=C0NZ76_AJECG|nr:uncharacterized protein HCBG_08456 [Histoplasma capsulatum G186AR]EEH03516.1 predicted protein [Histoplasma capsulatum G186AR]
MGKSVGSMVGIGGLEVDGPDVLLHERQGKVCGVQRAGRLAGCWRDPRGKIGKSKRALRGTTARSQDMRMDDLGRERKREVGVGARTRRGTVYLGGALSTVGIAGYLVLREALEGEKAKEVKTDE